MTGFEVKFKDHVIHASINDEGLLYVMTDYDNNSSYLHIGGSKSFERFSQYDGNIDDVDKIIIKVIDVMYNSTVVSTEPIDRLELIEQYHALKKEFEEKGLL
jgi:hypothetical protein